MMPWIRLLPHLSIMWDGAPTDVREALLAWKWPDLRFEYDGDAPGWWAPTERQLVKMWKEQVVYPTPGGAAFPAEEAFTILFPLVTALVKAIPPEATSDFRPHIQELLGYTRYILDEANDRLNDVLEELLLPHAHIAHRLFQTSPRFEDMADRRRQVSCLIHPVPPQESTAAVNGEPRPVFRVTRPVQSGEIQWAAWPQGWPESPSASASIPVYVQEHALLKLAERLRLYSKVPNRYFTERVRGVFELSLAYSLMAPQFSHRDGDDLWIKYMYGDDHLGYLVVALADGMAVVKTFLLCGMRDTPEERNLRRLGMDNRAVQWLKLDQLEQWMLADLRGDTQVQDALRACGFGGLLAMAELGYEGTASVSAEEMRRFISKDRLAKFLRGLELGKALNPVPPRATPPSSFGEGSGQQR